MPMPVAFDGYVEKPARVSSTCLVSVARNRYSVPCELHGQMVSTRLYPASVVIVADDSKVADAPLTMEDALKMSFSAGLIGPEQRSSAPILAGLALATPKAEVPDSADFVHLPKADESEWEEESSTGTSRDRAA